MVKQKSHKSKDRFNKRSKEKRVGKFSIAHPVKEVLGMNQEGLQFFFTEKLPTEYSWNEALIIYLKRLRLFFVVAICSLVLLFLVLLVKRALLLSGLD